MRRLLQLSARLYPRAWRERYGMEFDALLEDIPPSWRQASDILREALRMQVAEKRAYILTIAILATAGLLAGLVVNQMTPERYASSAIIEAKAGQFPFRPISDEERALNADTRLLQIRNAVLSRLSLEPLISRFQLYPREVATQTVTDAVELMRSHITVNVLRRKTSDNRFRQAVSITFVYPDPKRAQAVVNASIAIADSANREGSATVANEWRRHFIPGTPLPPGVQLSVLRSPTIPAKPGGPSPWLHGAMGVECGLALGLPASLMVRSPRRVLTLGAFAGAGCLLAAGLGYLTWASYTSSATIILRGPEIPDGMPSVPPSALLRRLASDAKGAERLALTSRALLLRDKDLPFERAIANLQRNLKVEVVGPPDAAEDSGLRITYTGPDRVTVQRTVSEAVALIVEDFQRAQKAECHDGAITAEACAIRQAKLGRTMGVLSPPSKQEEPDYPFAPSAAAGAVLGLAASTVIKQWPWRRLSPAVA